MTKIHLQANTGEHREPMAMCSTRVGSNGKVYNNGRKTYVGMGSEIVRISEFKLIHEATRCAHCCDILLERRNIKLKKNGMAQIARYNEGWER